MQQTEASRPQLRGKSALVLIGLIVAVAPTEHLSAVADTPWELEIFRLLILASVSIALVWSWAVRQGGSVTRRLYVWSALGGGAAVHYVISSASLALFLAFCLAAGASLDMWFTRAHLASEQIRDRLIGDRRRHRS
jgi:hypothetical protein